MTKRGRPYFARRVLAVSVGLVTSIGAPWTALAAGGTCPSPRAISRAVQELVGRPLVAAGKIEAEIAVEEDGDYFSVSVRNKTRILEDARRDCDKRAREAAVFVALLLAPPDFGPEPASEPAPTTPAVEVDTMLPVAVVATSSPSSESARSAALASVEAPTRRSALHPREVTTGTELGVGLLVATSGSERSPALVPGLDLLAVAFLKPQWAVVLEGTAQLASRFVVADVTIRQLRLPVAVLGRLAVGRALSLDGGPLVTPTWLRADRLIDADTALRLEVGLRGAVEVALPAANSPIFVRLSTDLLLVRPNLELAPQGAVGSTAPFWTSLTAGLKWGGD